MKNGGSFHTANVDQRLHPYESLPPYDGGPRWLDMEIAAVAAGAAGSLFGSLEENRICGSQFGQVGNSLTHINLI